MLSNANNRGGKKETLPGSGAGGDPKKRSEQIPLAKHIPREPKRLPYYPEAGTGLVHKPEYNRKQSEKVSDAAPRRSKAEREPGLQQVKWVPLIEKQGKGSAKEHIAAGRQFLAGILLNEKSPQATKRRQELMQEARKNLSGAQRATHASRRFSKMSGEDRRVVARFVDDVSKANLTFDELLDRAADSPRNLRAIQLIGLSLLEDGFSGNRQKQLTELNESQRRNVEVGQYLSMEAGRRLAEIRLQRGEVVSPAKAKVMRERFEQMSQHAALPEKYRRQFAETAGKFAERAGTQSSAEYQSTERSFRQNQQEYIKRPHEQAQTETQPRRHTEKTTPEHETQGFSPQVDIAIERELPSEQDPLGVETRRFWDDFDNQLDHAEYITDPSLWIRAASWVERVFRRPALHMKVFGAPGMWRAIFKPRAADKAMGQVRNKMVTMLQRAAQQTGEGDLWKKASTLILANQVEGRRIYIPFGLFEYRTPENVQEARSGEVVDTNDQAPAKNKSTSVNEGEIVDMNEVSPGSYEPVGYKEQPAAPGDLGDLHSQVESWQETHTDATYEDWAATASQETLEGFFQEAKKRQLKPGNLWTAWKRRGSQKKAA